MKMMTLLLRFFKSCYMRETKDVDKSYVIPVSGRFFFLFLEGGGDCKDCILLDGYYFNFIL